MTKFIREKIIGSNWVTVLQPTKKEAKVLKDKAVPVGTIYYIDEDLERTTVYYQVGSNPIAVQIQGISHYQADRIMELMPDCYVRGYVKSDTIFGNYEVLIHIGLINHGLYRVEEDIEEYTSEDCSYGAEEDTSEDYSSGLELCPHEEEDTSEDEEVLIRTELINSWLYLIEEYTSEDCSYGAEEDTSEDEEDTSEDYSDILELCQHEEEDTLEDCSDILELCLHEEEDTSEDCNDGAEEDTSIKGEVNMKFINGKLYMNDCGDGSELCPHKEEDTSEDYIETANVCGVEIKNYSVSLSETMLVHEAVEKELIGFLGDMSLERWELLDTDIDCTLGLDEQYNNMETGFIVFGAVLRVFASDVKYSRDYYLGYMAKSYNLRKWEIKELANLIDLGINLDSSVIVTDSLTLQDCLKSFVGAVQGYIRFKSQCCLDYEQTVEKLQTGDWFDRVAKFYLTLVCWGKFKPASCIDDDNNIDYYDYPVAIWNYNVSLGFFEKYDMYAIVFILAKNLNLDDEFIEEHYDGTMDIDTAINILDTWRNQQNKNFKVFPYNEQIKLKVLDHVIRKLKGVH